ncbi:NADH:ubiquinone oxidoreductase domain containing protein [Aphelenchoides fujianensis]|nr:NADH:ubiquinone oxidoreductase domain containing protein [Aphelenchoides fujianensis]
MGTSLSGRKVREMKATWEEMDAARLNAGERDYCAHLLIDFKACQRKYAPFAGHACEHARHVYDECEYEDHLMRLKEYERERRLLQRKKRKEAKAGVA